jgi:predicted ATP-dependent endonuclease of OLD family
MKLRAVEISNFKSFEHARLDNFELVNAITGPNNEGKSSVLEAISTLGHRGSTMPGGLNLDKFLQTRSIEPTGFKITLEMEPAESDLRSLGISPSRYLRDGIAGIKYEL